jgi:hypothetical protein
MEVLTIEGTEQTPAIVLDKESGLFEISGRSIAADSVSFYEPVLDWISRYSQNANPSTVFIFKFEYFNSATSKIIFDILARLEKIEGSRVIWAYAGNNREMEESGLDFAELVNIPFELKMY